MPRSANRDPKTGLTDQMRLFADNYLASFDATASYKAAGYKSKGAAARVSASQLLAKPLVQAYLKARMEKISARLELKAEDVIDELRKVGFFDPRKVLTGNGDVKPVEEWDDDSAAAVQALEVEALFEGRGEDRLQIGYTKKVKLHSKVSALEKLGQHLGLFRQKIEMSGPNGGPVKTEVAGVLVVPMKDSADAGGKGS